MIAVGEAAGSFPEPAIAMPRHRYDRLVWPPARRSPSRLVPRFPSCARKLPATALGQEEPRFGVFPLIKALPEGACLQAAPAELPKPIAAGDVRGVVEELRGLGRVFFISGAGRQHCHQSTNAARARA